LKLCSLSVFTKSIFLYLHSFFFSHRNIQILKQQLSGLWEQENHLTLVPGYTGNIAKDVDAYLLQLN